MNKYQRIALVIGAIVLVLLLWTTPKLVVYQGSTVKYANAVAANDYLFEEWKKQMDKGGSPLDFPPPTGVGEPFRDTNEIAIRTIGVLGATILIFFALKGIKEKSKPLPDAKKVVEKKSV